MKKLLVLLAVFSILALLGGLWLRPEAARGAKERLPSKKAIVFSGGNLLWSVEPNGRNLHPLNKKTKRVRWPAWSPDKTKVAFVGGENQELAVLDVKKSRIKKVKFEGRPLELTQGPIAWQPRKNILALNIFEDPMWGSIYYYNLDENVSELFWTKQYDTTMESDPTFSPKGDAIAFVWNERTDGDYQKGPADLWRINRDGQNLTRIASVGAGNFAYSPDWSPKSNKIVFEMRTMAGWDNNDSKHSHIHLVNADGTGHQLLIKNGRSPAFSPDGTKIVFIRDNKLWVMKANGRGVKRIKSVQFARDPDW